MRILIAAFCAAFFVSACQTTVAPVEVSCPQHTLTPAKMQEVLDLHQFSHAVEMKPDEAALVAKNFNGRKPVTNWPMERVVVYSNTNAAAVVMYLPNGCAYTPGIAHPMQVAKWLQKVLGLGV